MTIVEVIDDKKEKYQSFTARWDTSTAGGMGVREAALTGWGAADHQARMNLIEQAKALRDELNAAIEGMIDELARATVPPS